MGTVVFAAADGACRASPPSQNSHTNPTSACRVRRFQQGNTTVKENCTCEKPSDAARIELSQPPAAADLGGHTMCATDTCTPTHGLCIVRCYPLFPPEESTPQSWCEDM